MGEVSTDVKGLLPKLCSLFNNPLFSDVDFEFKEDSGRILKLYGHKLILALRSNYFASVFYEKKEEAHSIAMASHNSSSFYFLLKFLYTDDVQFQTVKEAEDLHLLAQQYGVKELEAKCLTYLLEEVITMENIFSKYEYALHKNIESLLKCCRAFISRETKSVFESAYFDNVSIAVMEDIVKQEHLSIPTELVIVNAVLKWGKAKCKKDEMPADDNSLRQCIYPFMKHIRFLTLTAMEFQSILKDYNIFDGYESNLLTCKILQPQLGVDIPEYICGLSFKRSTSASGVASSIASSKLKHDNIFSSMKQIDLSLPSSINSAKLGITEQLESQRSLSNRDGLSCVLNDSKFATPKNTTIPASLDDGLYKQFIQFLEKQIEIPNAAKSDLITQFKSDVSVVTDSGKSIATHQLENQKSSMDKSLRISDDTNVTKQSKSAFPGALDIDFYMRQIMDNGSSNAKTAHTSNEPSMTKAKLFNSSVTQDSKIACANQFVENQMVLSDKAKASYTSNLKWFEDPGLTKQLNLTPSTSKDSEKTSATQELQNQILMSDRAKASFALNSGPGMIRQLSSPLPAFPNSEIVHETPYDKYKHFHETGSLIKSNQTNSNVYAVSDFTLSNTTQMVENQNLSSKSSETNNKFSYEIKKKSLFTRSNTPSSLKPTKFPSSSNLYVPQFSHPVSSSVRTFDFCLSENILSLTSSFHRDIKCTVSIRMKSGSIKLCGFELYVKNLKSTPETLEVDVETSGFSDMYSKVVKEELKDNMLRISFSSPLLLRGERKGELQVSVDSLCLDRCRVYSSDKCELNSGSNFMCEISINSNQRVPNGVAFLINRFFYVPC